MTNVWTNNEEANLWALIEGYGLAKVLDKMAALCETQSAQEMDDGTEVKAKEWDHAVAILDLAKESFTVKTEEEIDANNAMRAMAREEWLPNDEIEIDDDAEIKPNGEGGAWVHAWLYFPVEACKTCEAIEGTKAYGTVGDGEDGDCGNCADKRVGGEA